MKKPQAVPNAKRIALKAWSMWANYLGIAALIAPEVIYYFWQVDTNPRIWWVLGLGLILAGIAGRLIDQGMTRSPALVGVLAAFIAMGQVPVPQSEPRVAVPSQATTSYTQRDFLGVAVPLIEQWEGEHRCKDDPSMHCAYLDRIASPPIWTACHGETKGIRRGMRFTDAECKAMLAREVLSYRRGWHGYLKPETLTQRLHAERDAAFTSLAYNVGVGGAGKSTATRRLNAGRIAGACDAISWWSKAGGRVVRGLVRRRAAEYELCMIGV